MGAEVIGNWDGERMKENECEVAGGLDYGEKGGIVDVSRQSQRGENRPADTDEGQGR